MAGAKATAAVLVAVPAGVEVGERQKTPEHEAPRTDSTERIAAEVPVTAAATAEVRSVVVAAEAAVGFFSNVNASPSGVAVLRR